MNLTLPSGRQVTPPVVPYTWVEQSLPDYGWAFSSGLLEDNVSAAVAFHRQRPFFQGVNSSGTSIPAFAWTPMPLTEIIDNVSGHNDSANPSRWYAPSTSNTSDWYLVTGYVPMSSTSTTAVHIAGVRVDGGGSVFEGTKITSGPHSCTPMVVDLVRMTSDGTHYLELMGFQSTAAAVNTPTSGKIPSISVQWVCSGAGLPTAPLPAVPRTWAATDLVTADSVGGPKVPLNVHIRDTIRWLDYPPIARLTSVGAGQSIVSGTGYTSINLASENADNYGGHDIAVNNTRYVCQRDGLYLVAGQYSTDENGGANVGYRSVRLLHTMAAGGTATYYGNGSVPGSTTTVGTHLIAAAPIRMVAGDYVEVQAQQSQGASRLVLATVGDCSRLNVVWRSR